MTESAAVRRRNPAMSELLVLGGALILVGAAVGIISGTSAAQSERTGKYEAILGGYGSYSRLAETQQIWMWVGVGAAIVGELILIGVLFVQAVRR